MHLPKIVFTLVLLLSLLTAHSTATAQEHYREASQLYMQALYRNSSQAMAELEALHKKHPADPDINLYLGRLYISEGRFGEAMSLFGDILQDYPTADILPERLRQVYALMGIASFNMGQYGNAQQYLSEYLNKGFAAPAERRNLLPWLENANWALKAMKDSVEFTPEQLPKPINSRYGEFNPVLTADGKWLLFTAHHPNNMGQPGTDVFNYYPADIYAARYDNGATSGQPIPLRGLNSSEHDKEFCVSVDGKLLIFGRHAARPDRNKGLSCTLFQSEINLTGELPTAKPPLPLKGGVASAQCDSWPSLSPSGDTLYFCSNRPGGRGGFDLYYAIRTGPSSFGEARNIRGLNTPGDEYDVFIHPNGKTLYWSTDGRTGFGGQDIYMAELGAGGVFGKVKNLGWPINSPFQDMDFFVTTDGLYAFYNSDRMESFGDNDIFRFQLDEKVQPKLDTIVLRNITFQYDHEDPDYKAKQDLERALEWINSKPKSSQFLVIGHTDAQGPKAYNQDLSERRAKAVVKWLINHYVDEDRLTPIGYGESALLCRENTEKAHKLNRRVEIRMR